VYILGINAHHAGASACLIRDGELIAAAEEERFRRIKYWAGFPTRAIAFCLAEAGIPPYELDHVGISRDPNANLLKKVAFAVAHRPSASMVRARLANAMQVRNPKAALCEAFSLDPKRLRARFHSVEHHRAHMASAFYVSPFANAAVLSVDGMGDFVSTMWGVGKGTQLSVSGEINFPHSLGFVYTATSQWLGFPKYGDEGKVMGLAPYGRPVYLDEFRKIVRVQQDGTFELDLDYFVHHAAGASMTFDEGSPEIGTMYSETFVDTFGEARAPGAPLTELHQDVAASLQAMLEEAEFALVRRLQHETAQSALCIAGGVALNSAFNGKVLPETPFTDIYIQPAANDAGTALGVCYYIYHHVLGQPRGYVMNAAYTGPRFGGDAIREALDRRGLAYQRLDETTLARRGAELVAGGDVLGWFQGRMEWGPRALGNRSIIADPRRADMKDILNARIKHREAFRPFAPSVLLEAVGDYFDQTYPDPFMVKVYNVLPGMRARIPAVTHVDGTGRLQTVDRGANSRYWALISAFRDLTGVPVVLNTSFNDNEPIVCTPDDAIECFLRTRMDALVLDDLLVQK
jgi:carbamoyltransferase